MPDSDPGSPNIAGAYDAILRSNDSRDDDTPGRNPAAEVLGEVPQVADIVAENRRFLARAVSWLADQGIDQFLDLGCGMPAEPNTHEISQGINPDSRVAYVDRNEVAVGRMSAFAGPGSGVTAIRADVSDPGATRAALAGAIDFTRPAAVLMCALLHFYDAAAAREIIAGHTSGLAPGSYLVVSILGSEGKATGRLVRSYSASIARLYSYSAAEVTDLLDPFELVPPGVIPQDSWRPGRAETPPGPAPDLWIYGAVSRVGAAAG